MKSIKKYHKYKVTVYYEDTDAGQIIYHANYLKYSERARTEYLKSLGYNHIMLRENHGIFLVVKSLNLNFYNYGRLEDVLDVISCVKNITRVYIDFEQTIFKNNVRIATISSKICATNTNGRVTRIPIEMVKIIKQEFKL